MKAQERSWKALGDFIRTQRRLADLSLRQLSSLAKVSNPYLSQVERGLYKPSAGVLKGIAEALEISAESLFARAGLLSEDSRDREPDVSVEKAIKLDRHLSPSEKETLIRVYHGFVGKT